MSADIEFGPSHWLTDGSPANAGYRTAAAGLSTACPYERGTTASFQWWKGYWEGCYSFGPPRAMQTFIHGNVFIKRGHDHPEWV